MAQATRRTIMAVFLALGTGADRAAGQESSGDRWSVTLAVGTTFGGPTEAMASELRRDGYEVHEPAPRSDILTYGYSGAARLLYRIDRRFGTGVLYASDPFASVGAYNSYAPFGSALLEPYVRTAALLGAYQPIDRRVWSLRLDAGPAVHWATLRDAATKTKLGAVVGAGYSLHMGMVRLSVDGQHRFIGDVEYEYESSSGGLVDRVPNSITRYSSSASA